jgi:hypothetical protein
LEVLKTVTIAHLSEEAPQRVLVELKGIERQAVLS